MKKQNYCQIGFLCLLLCLMMTTAAWAVVEAPTNIYVGDYADVLTEETEQLIITENQRLETATGAQIVVVTVDFLDGMDIEDYAYTIFNDWGIGNADKNNGLLLLLTIGEENYWAMQGSGIAKDLSSSLLGDYLYDYLEDDFAAGRYDAGVAKVFQAFVSWYDNYYQLNSRDHVSSGIVNDAMSNQNGYAYNETGYTDESEIDFGNLLFLLLVVIVVLIFLSNRKRKKDLQSKAKTGSMPPMDYPDMTGGSMPSSRRSRPYYAPPRTGGPGSFGGNQKKTTSAPTSSSFGGGKTRGGGVGRNSASGLGKSIGKSISSGSSIGRSFGGGGSRGGGAGRR